MAKNSAQAHWFLDVQPTSGMTTRILLTDDRARQPGRVDRRPTEFAEIACRRLGGLRTRSAQRPATIVLASPPVCMTWTVFSDGIDSLWHGDLARKICHR